MRQRLSQFVLLAIPISLILGEQAALRIGNLPLYWFELFIALYLGLVIPELRAHAASVARQLPRTFWVAIGLLMLGLMLSTATAELKQEALGAVKAWFLMPMLLLGAIVFARQRVEGLLFGIVLHALLQTTYGMQLISLQEEARLMGSFSSANFYAAVVVPAIFLVWLLPIPLRWFFSLVLILALFSSQSIGGILGLVGGALYVALVYLKGSARLAVLSVAIGAALIGGALAHQRFADNPRSSFVARQEIWQVAGRVIRENPLTGVGLRNFADSYIAAVPFITTDPIEWNVPEPHNQYLAFWTGLSLFGLLGMLLLVGVILASGGVVAAPVAALMTHGLVDTPLFKVELAVLFWCYIALVLVSRRDLK
jgi:O-antigen ligase